MTTELASYGLTGELSSAFFAVPPQSSARWLILVDGLDEIADPAARNRVLRTIAAVSKGEDRDLYRFAITTRPLPNLEFRALDDKLPRYDLLPFRPDDLPAIATSWFRASGLADPSAVAVRFTRALARSRLADVARIPLMASMLCQLHAAAPGQPLPAGRGRIYHDFIDLLHKHQYTSGPTGFRGRAYAGLERYGDRALAQAEQTLDCLHNLIAYLAAERYNGSSSRALDIMESQPQAARPPRVPHDEWRAFLSDCLRRSGLLSVRAGEPVFLHQTLLEYLAARHLTRDPQAAAHILHKVFHQPARYGRSFAPGVRPRVWFTLYWKPPPGDPSYLGFLLDTAHSTDPSAAAQFLGRLASRRGGLAGCRFIATQVQLGTYISPDLIQATVDLCQDLARDTAFGVGPQTEAAKMLEMLGDRRSAMNAWYDLALDATLSPRTRRDACMELERLGGERIMDVWDSFARATAFGDEWRTRAAQNLVEQGDPRGADVCHILVCDVSVSEDSRFEAINMLTTMDDPRSADLLYDMAGDHQMSEAHRLEAARMLASLEDSRSLTALHRLAGDAAVSSYGHAEAAWAMAGLGAPHGADLCHALAIDTNLDGQLRLQSAQTLIQIGDTRSADLCHTLANDPLLARHHRLEATRTLVELDLPHGANLCHALAIDTNLDGQLRLQSAQTLIQIGDTRSADL
ncbi:NACHT domain-containing protein, partial [Streptomyces canus]|uniref:NACHT domain-containing protein n=1 Tax=Streptomyces canus TaxID=58343 RepID=UPI0036B2506D